MSCAFQTQPSASIVEPSATPASSLKRREDALVRQRPGRDVEVVGPVLALEGVGEVERLVVGAPARAVRADDAGVHLGDARDRDRGATGRRSRAPPCRPCRRRRSGRGDRTCRRSAACAVARSRPCVDEVEPATREVEEVEPVVEREHRAPSRRSAMAPTSRSSDQFANLPVRGSSCQIDGFADAPAGAVHPVAGGLPRRPTPALRRGGSRTRACTRCGLASVSIFAPETFTAWAYFSLAERMRAAYSCGELPTGSMSSCAKRCATSGRLHRFGDLLRHARDDRGRRTGGGEQADLGREVVAGHAELGDRRHLGRARRALDRAHREQLHAPRLHVRGDRGQRRVDERHLPETIAGTDSPVPLYGTCTMPHRVRTSATPWRGDECCRCPRNRSSTCPACAFASATTRRSPSPARGVRDQEEIRSGDQADRGKILRRVVRELGVQERVDRDLPDIRDEEGVAVGRGARHRFAARNPAGAAAVLDVDLLTQAFG